ncbi:MAG TPA: 6-phosphofructokinase [Armatimonadetes bacterium]|nr:6-phosphofructokinase [Armatimonadota bacterium]
MANQQRKVGILVGGGPAPGINGVIGAVTIGGRKRGWEVIGIYDGLKGLVQGDTSQVVELDIPQVSRLHFLGGSHLRTSRENVLKEVEEEGRKQKVPDRDEGGKLDQTIKALQSLGVTDLVTIGGDDTAFSASLICEWAKGTIKVAHVPKTIDNDLDLPDNMPTFGFHTARHEIALVVRNLMEDARTTGRWYFIVVMGRKAGHLALGAGKAAGATLTIIGEELGDDTPLEELVKILEGTIIKRKAMGRNDGVAVIAEGVAYKLRASDLEGRPGVKIELDPAGHPRLAEVPLARIFKEEVREAFKKRGQKVTIVDITLGYEFRCAPPIPFDQEYVRDLGAGAVRYLAGEIETPAGAENGALICLQGGRITPLPFTELMDPETGRMRVRLVNTQADTYRIAREYMIRLEKADFEDESWLQRLAEAAGMYDVNAFRARFASLVG